MEAVSSTLSFMGALLFLLGLLTGFGIPAFRSPRIGLSAHLDAIQSGLALIAFGLLLLTSSRISLGWASFDRAYDVDLLVRTVARPRGRRGLWDWQNLPNRRRRPLVAKQWQENTARTLISVGSLAPSSRSAPSSPNGAGTLELFDSTEFWWAVPGSNRRPAD